MDVAIAYEDLLQEKVLEKIFATYALSFNIVQRLSRNGKGYLEKKAKALNTAARNGLPVVLLTDLDTTACPPSLVHSWLGGKPHPDFLLRVATREVESWLIADKISLASFLGVSAGKFKLNAEEIVDPKAYIISLARGSRSRAIREDIPPMPHSNAKIGAGYNRRLSCFIMEKWNPVEASTRSASLAKAVNAMVALHTRLGKA